MSGWTGSVRVLPRASFENAGDVRGLYVLVGPDSTHPRNLHLYVGKAERLQTRLMQHDHHKEWWERVAVITASDLTGDMTGQLESRLVALARRTVGVTLDNVQDPTPVFMDHATTHFTEIFLKRTITLLRLLGIDAFTPDAPTQSGSGEWCLSRAGARATATMRDGQLVVLAGSVARPDVTPSCPALIRARRETLRSAGQLGSDLRFTADVPFDSPSAAAGVVLGMSANGRSEWRNVLTGRTWGEQHQLAQ